MSYFIHYATVLSVPIGVEWVCSKCGFNNRAQYKYYASGQAMGHSGSLRDSIIERNGGDPRRAEKEESGNQAEWLLEYGLSHFPSYVESNVYGSCQIDCKCASCGNKEPWSRLTSPFARAHNQGLDAGGDLFSMILNLLSLVWLPFDLLHTRFCEKAIEKLPGESLPTLILPDTESGVRLWSKEKAKRIEAERIITDRSSNSIPTQQASLPHEMDAKASQKQMMYCRKCGNPITADSIFCSHCGQKLI